MKIAITSQGREMTDAVDQRFGRAKFFIVADTRSGETSAVDNMQNLNAAQGAGIQAGANVVSLGVEAVITGHVGPKAFATLNAGGVKIYTGAGGGVADALEKFKAGELTQIQSADVESHWV
ncbi:MAG TPA: NifB/NifX family molybdenum-iron cluster-binding protein [Phycisphaerae bacterium]|nr:NifB/NifX family molybdenum-iron cluster-binding protein [Phycisphaerae bacterium]HPS53115.1 NifB/NifX family molybdenum-iron cluster-binding protein [Phycisphaerae bacterium]